MLAGQLERLKGLKAWIAESAGDNLREQIRADAVQVAIDHVQTAMDALELAAQE